MKHRWACYAPPCRDGREPFFFEAERRVPCPQCGGGSEVVARCLRVHFLTPSPTGLFNGLQGKFACACGIPSAKELTERYEQASGSVEGITCPACLDSAVYKAALDTACLDGRFEHTIAGVTYGA